VNFSRALFGLLLGRRLPRTSGELRVEGLGGPVSIRRDRWGIPHVVAGSDEDAAFALGFLQGQDRPFQLEMLLRTVRGTAAEAIGKAGLPIDRLSRRIGFRRGTAEQLETLEPGPRSFIEGFCRGVGAAYERGLPRRSHGHAIARIAPTPWEPSDAMAIHRLASFVLPSNWDSELVRLRMLVDDGPEAVRSLSGAYADWLPLETTGRAAVREVLDAVEGDLERLAAAVGAGGASNAWALSGARTASGRPLVANDPHLAPQLPPHWYLTHVRTPEWEVAGASFVGMPFFLSGHNGRVAWGVTAGLVDNTDFFLERLDGDRVRRGDGWEACRRWTETIRVRGGGQVEEEIVETPRGPVVGPALRGADVEDTGLPGGGGSEPGRLALALRATWLEPRPLGGFLLAHRARSFEELRGLFREWPTVSFSVVGADLEGMIGWQLVGEAPVRKGGWGTLPAPGWDPRSGWEEDRVPFEAMPRRVDPEEGFVVSANNKPAEDGPERPWLGIDWIDGYRAARIEEALAERSDWDVASCLALQRDVVSLPWREIREDVLALAAEALAGEAPAGEAPAGEAPAGEALPGEAPAASAAAAAGAEGSGDRDLRLGLELLRAWDGRMTPDSPGASVYELVNAGLVTRLVHARAPRASAWILGRGFHLLTPRSFFARKGQALLARLLRERAEGWLEAPWREAVAASVREAVARLRTDAGGDPSGWAWGEVRELVLEHPLGEVGPLGRVFDLRPASIGGDTQTVTQAAALPLDPLGPASAIPSLRAAIPLGDPEGARFALPGGQSGNPCSPHYDDMLEPWRTGTGVPIPWSEESVRRAAVEALDLVPGDGAAGA